MILIIGPFPEPINGCSFANEVFCRNLQEKGIKYKTINTSIPEISSQQGTRFSFRKALRFVKTYFECYKLFQTKVVYLTPGQTFFGIIKYAPFVLLCILLMKPYLIHIHGNYLGTEYKRLGGLKKRLFHFLISNASAGIVLSESLKENFHGLLANDKIFIVENFVDDKLIDSYELDKKPIDMPRILYLSNLMEEKGILDLLDALILLQGKGFKFKAQFAGGIEDTIKEQVDKKLVKLKERVEYLGLVKGQSKIDMFTNANIFVLPTYYQMEGQPISILEGMASGNIIISTLHAGIPDIMDSKNGYFVSPKNPNELADTIEMINQDLKNQVSKFSILNSSYAKTRFTEHMFFDKIINIIHAISN